MGNNIQTREAIHLERGITRGPSDAVGQGLPTGCTREDLWRIQRAPRWCTKPGGPLKEGESKLCRPSGTSVGGATPRGGWEGLMFHESRFEPRDAQGRASIISEI